MKMRFWLACALSVGCAVFAQETATVSRNRVNVRAQPTTNSEVLTQLNEGDKVTVFEEITAPNARAGEPAVWAKIKLPANTPLWVFSGGLEEHTVKVSRLNLRAGPGENYSILGRLDKGEKVTEIRSIEDWMEIEAPDSLHAYVDASYLSGLKRPEIAKPKLNPTPSPAEVVKDPVIAFEPKKEEPKKEEPKKEEPKVEAPKVVEAPKPAEPIVEKTEVKEEPKVVAAAPVEKKEEAPELKEEKKETTPAPATTPEPVDRPAEITRVLPQIGQPVPSAAAAVEAGSTKRIVRREGSVRSTRFNPDAPTYFELRAGDGTIINYLIAEKSGFKLKDYNGLRVVVTGEESIDKRYPKRPLLDVETIEVAP